jgi:hypothetical protein
MDRRDFIKTTCLLSAGSVMAGNDTGAQSTQNLEQDKFMNTNSQSSLAEAGRRNLASHQRQVHLDFHTSPFIHDVAQNFDAGIFAERIKKASINSVTVFAKCHHGMSYYPTRVGLQHPSLKGRDLLGEMLEALHREGIRAPIYTTIGWEENIAAMHPEWRQVKKDGSFAMCSPGADPGAKQQAPWKFNDWLNPEYQDYIESHINEILAAYDVDGFFIDILFYHPEGGWSDECIKFRNEHGLIKDTPENHYLFEARAQEQFGKRFSPLINGRVPDASIFYNTPNNVYVMGDEGVLRKAPYQTHFEIESLPSGFWGYYHFPRLARRLAYKGKPWLGMTGKFQKMWGDFGGIKPQAALEYECFRSQALGGGNSVGDQLHPRGVLDEETYQLIGSVFKQTAAAEPFYHNSSALPQIGVLSPHHPALNDTGTSKSEEGAVLLFEELHYDCAILDDSSDLSGFELIVLPDSVVMTDKLKAKLSERIKKGGKLLLSYKSGFNRDDQWALTELPLLYEGDVEVYPTFWKPSDQLAYSGLKSERVFYQQGLNMRATGDLKVMVDRIVPYFKRSDVKFCSHFQTPPDKTDPVHPAVMGNDQFIYFADPIFSEYRQSGNIFIKKILQVILEKLAGKPLAGHGLSSSILTVPRQRDRNLIITLLYYIPVRKCLDIDVIEQGQSFAGEVLHLPLKVKSVFCVTTGKNLARNEKGGFALPDVRGRLLLEVKDYFG